MLAQKALARPESTERLQPRGRTSLAPQCELANRRINSVSANSASKPKGQLMLCNDIDTEQPASRQHEMTHSFPLRQCVLRGGGGHRGGAMYPNAMMPATVDWAALTPVLVKGSP